MNYKYPCTGNIKVEGFGKYLEENIKEPRRNIQLFSKELKEKYNIPFISLVNSGSSANLVAAMAMAEKIKRKNKPLKAVVSAFTFPTTVSSLVMAGFDISIVDVEKDRFTIDYKKIEEKILGASLIVPTHFLGFPANMKHVREIAKEYDCFILQDACETINLIDDNKEQYFNYGDITTWSFYHPHHLSSYGGGAVICLNEEDYLLTDSIGHWGRACKCHVDPLLCKVPPGPAHQFTYERLGINVEMSELNACFGRWQFRDFKEQEEIRKENYNILYEMLCKIDGLKVYKHPNIGGSLFVFPIYLDNGLEVTDAYNRLCSKGVEIRTLMGGVINSQKAFSYMDNSSFENANDMFNHTFFVGIHQTLSSSQIREVAQIIETEFS